MIVSRERLSTPPASRLCACRHSSKPDRARSFETTSAYGWIGLLVLPFLSAFATVMLVHAVDAIIWATILSYLGAMLIGFLVVGYEYMIVMLASQLGTYMFAAAVLGAIAGIFLRPWVRARYKV